MNEISETWLQSTITAALPQRLNSPAIIMSDKSHLFSRIALDLSDPERVLKVIENRKRRARPELEANFGEPSNPIHKQLAKIWIEVLAIERVGIHDNFFKLGGNSILATQLLARVRESFQVELPLRSIFETPTVAGLSVALIQNRAALIESQELEELMANLEQLSEEEAQTMLDAQVKPHDGGVLI